MRNYKDAKDIEVIHLQDGEQFVVKNGSVEIVGVRVGHKVKFVSNEATRNDEPIYVTSLARARTEIANLMLVLEDKGGDVEQASALIETPTA